MQPISRWQFAKYGFALMLLKITIDRFVCFMTGVEWTPLLYWQPLRASMQSGNNAAALWLTGIAVPFIGLGIWLTLRRLATLHLPRWLLFLFFLPAVNLLFFAYLLLLDETRADPASETVSLYDPMVGSAMAGAAGSVAVGLSVAALGSFGVGAFLGVPFGIGVLSTLLYCRKEPHSFKACAAVALLSMMMCGGTLLLIAVEGVICLIMSAPLAIPLVLLGVFFGRAIALPGRMQQQAMIFMILIPTICPLIAGGERLAKIIDETQAVVTSIEIAASPEQVWKNVVEFPELPAEREWIFHTGIAYPIRARIEGTGVGAIRYCEFSTGPFVEPITKWQQPELLAFDVTSSPSPMQELSPWDIQPSHLNGFLRSQRGQFRLIPLDGGRRTRLEGTTWYQQSLYPASYWQILTDAIIHKIHYRVLDHIRQRSEEHKLN